MNVEDSVVATHSSLVKGSLSFTWGSEQSGQDRNNNISF